MPDRLIWACLLDPEWYVHNRFECVLIERFKELEAEE